MNKFETLAKVWLGTMLALSFTEGCAPLAKTTETPTPTPTIEPTGTPTIAPEILAGTPQAQLYATVSALETAELQNSFVPEGKFTKELYEHVVEATFPIFVTTDGGLSMKQGTSFVVGKEGNTIYLVTNRHVIQGNDINNPKDPSAIGIFANVASKADGSLPVLITFDDMQFVVSETRDIALVRANVPDDEDALLISTLAYQDDYVPKVEQRVLAVGWPKEFTEEKIPYYTSATYLSVVFNRADYGEWGARGLLSSGSSGSPVIVPDTKGNPVVIGIVAEVGNKVAYPNGTLTVDRLAYFYPLEIDALKRKLEST